MNIVSSMPSWAQNATQKLQAQKPIEGETRSPITEEGFQELGQAMFASAMLASMDENPGADQAMEQPGFVVQDEVQIRFLGNPQDQTGDFESALSGNGDEGEMAVYLNKTEEQIQTFAFAKDETGIKFQGAVVRPTASGEMEGYLVAGTL